MEIILIILLIIIFVLILLNIISEHKISQMESEIKNLKDDLKEIRGVIYR